MRRSLLVISVVLSAMFLVSPLAQAEFVTQPQDKLRGAADIGMASESGGIEQVLTMD